MTAIGRHSQIWGYIATRDLGPSPKGSLACSTGHQASVSISAPLQTTCGQDLGTMSRSGCSGDKGVLTALSLPVPLPSCLRALVWEYPPALPVPPAPEAALLQHSQGGGWGPGPSIKGNRGGLGGIGSERAGLGCHGGKGALDLT